MQRRPHIRTPALPAVVLAALLSTLLVAAGATAGPLLSRKQADAIAIRVLRPQADKGEVILFGLPKPLPAGTVVTPADPARRSLGKRVRTRVKPLAAPAWLYWLDRTPDAAFSHPSEFVLIDDRSGRVVRRTKIGWYPSVDGRPPAFLVSNRAYARPSFRVYARVDGASTRRTAAATLERPPSVVPKQAFKNDCILMAGDFHGPGFTQDFRELARWGTGAGVRSFYATQNGPKTDAPPAKEPGASGSTLRSNVDTLVEKQDCKDLLVVLDGHGVPRGQGSPTVISSNDVEVEVEGQIEKFTTGITAEDVSDVIRRHPQTGFKLKVNSCYSGRFLDELAPNGEPKLANLLVAESASGADQESYFGREAYDDKGKWKGARAGNSEDLSEFVNQNVTGLYTWSSSQTEVAASVAAGGSLLANGLERAFVLGRPNNAAIKLGAIPEIARGEAGDPVQVTVNTFGLSSDFKTPWIPAWVDNGTTNGAVVFSDRAGNQVGALDPANGRADRFPLRAITNPNGIAAIDPFRFAVAGSGGVAIFDRTPPGKITELVLQDSRLVNLAVGPNENLYVTNIADNSFVTIRPPYSGPADVSRTPLPSCLRPTGIVPTAAGLTVLCQQTNNIVFLNPTGGLIRSVALPTPNIGAQEPKPTGRSGIVFSGFGSNRVYRHRGNGLESVAAGRGPAVPTIAYYPDDYADMFANQTADDYAFVPHFTGGGATVAEFNGDGESEQLSILAARNLVGSGIGPGCSPWVADATPGGPRLHRVSFSIPGAPTRPRTAGANVRELPVTCTDFTDASRTHAVTASIPSAWTQAGRVEFGIVGYRGDPWGAKATFLANFPLELDVRAIGGGSGSPRVTLRQTGAYTAVATVAGVPANASAVTVTVTSKGTDAPFGLLTAARVRRSPKPANVCNCTNLSVVGARYSSAQVNTGEAELNLNLNWTMTCSGPTGRCTGRIEITPPAGSDIQLASPKDRKVKCSGSCLRRQSRGTTRMKATSSGDLYFDNRAGKSFAFRLRLYCARGGKEVLVGSKRMTFAFGSGGFLDKKRSDLNGNGVPDGKERK